MEFTYSRTVKVTAYILLTLVVTQAVYTALYLGKIPFPRGYIWGLEGFLFSVLAAFAGAALAQTKSNHLAWSAISFSAVFNLIQVSIGLKLFPTIGAIRQIEGLAPLGGGIVDFSFMIYNAAKILLGLAALIVGLSKVQTGAAIIGRLTALAGGVALLANAVLIILGRDAFLPSSVGGGAGAVATLLLAVCLLSATDEE